MLSARNSIDEDSYTFWRGKNPRRTVWCTFQNHLTQKFPIQITVGHLHIFKGYKAHIQGLWSCGQIQFIYLVNGQHKSGSWSCGQIHNHIICTLNTNTHTNSLHWHGSYKENCHALSSPEIHLILDCGHYLKLPDFTIKREHVCLLQCVYYCSQIS